MSRKMGRPPNNGSSAMSNADRQHAYRERLKLRRQTEQIQRRKEVRKDWAKPASTLTQVPGGTRKRLAKLLTEIRWLEHKSSCDCVACDIERLRQHNIGLSWDIVFDVADA